MPIMDNAWVLADEDRLNYASAMSDGDRDWNQAKGKRLAAIRAASMEWICAASVEIKIHLHFHGGSSSLLPRCVAQAVRIAQWGAHDGLAINGVHHLHIDTPNLQAPSACQGRLA